MVIPFIILYLKIGVGIVLLQMYYNLEPFIKEPIFIILSMLLWPTVVQFIIEET